MTLPPINKMTDDAFTEYMNQFKPDNCYYSKIEERNKVRHMIFYVEEEANDPPTNIDASYRKLIKYPIGLREPPCDTKFTYVNPHSYAPVYGIKYGLNAIKDSFQMALLSIKGHFTHTVFADTVKSDEYYIISKSSEYVVQLKCCERLTILALAIALLVRGMLETLSLGCLNLIFYPLDAIFDRCMKCKESPEIISTINN